MRHQCLDFSATRGSTNRAKVDGSLGRKKLGICIKVTGVKGGVALLTGGLALDSGLLAAIQEEMVNEKVQVRARSHPDSIYAGAIGAALWGAFRHARLSQLEAVATA